MISRPHWSYSQIAQYLRCPLQYFFERIAKLPKPFASSSLVLGSAVHVALAEYHRSLQSGQVPTTDSIQDAFLANWSERELERPILFTDGEQRHDAIDQGVALLEIYQRQDPPTQIIGVEQTFVVPIITSNGEVLDRPLVAIVDLLRRDESGLVVTEFKTTGRRFSDAQLDSALQATAYVHAAYEKYDEIAAVNYVVLVRTKTPQIQRLETVRSESDLFRFGDLVQSVQRAIEAEAFHPIENAMNCSSCPFRLPCRDWSGPAHSGEDSRSGVCHQEEITC